MAFVTFINFGDYEAGLLTSVGAVLKDRKFSSPPPPPRPGNPWHPGFQPPNNQPRHPPPLGP
ncbi:hypothetical protein E2542_SST31038 [Spatholobus suberectus]|nr:hypothetical protein E2542_SST31038 [Spatholobus suberectus]